MKQIILFILFAFIGCQQPKKNIEIVGAKQEIKPPLKLSDKRLSKQTIKKEVENYDEWIQQKQVRAGGEEDYDAWIKLRSVRVDENHKRKIK